MSTPVAFTKWADLDFLQVPEVGDELEGQAAGGLARATLAHRVSLDDHQLLWKFENMLKHCWMSCSR